MFPISDKPLIAYAVEEAYSAGIRQMIFITNSKKKLIESYFNDAYEIESEFEKHIKKEPAADPFKDLRDGEK